MQADAILRAMEGGAVLHKQFVEGVAAYHLSDSQGLAHVPIAETEARKVAASSLVTPCEPGLFDGDAQSYRHKNGGDQALVEKLKKNGQPESWLCVDCGMNTAPGAPTLAEFANAMKANVTVAANFDTSQGFQAR
jgi:hypothetical protein